MTSSRQPFRVRRGMAALALAMALAPAGAAAQDREGWPSSFTVGTASQGGTYFIYGSGWANLVSEATGVNGGAEVTGGPVQNAALVHSGRHEFGMVTMGPAREAWTGQSPLLPQEHTNLRAIFPMYQTPFQTVTLAGSGIASLTDVPDGATVGVGPAGGTSDTYFPRFYETLGIEIRKRNGGASDLAGQLQDGLIEVFSFAAGYPISAFSQLEAQVDVNIFGFTDDQIEQLVAAFPVARFEIPETTYRTLEAPMSTVAMWNFAVANADLPETFVYEVVGTVMENHDRMVQVHGAARETRPEHVDKNTFLPWHPGAVRWFEENGYEIPDALEGRSG